MRTKYDIRLTRTSAPVREPVTKFGGQPTWLSTPAWPISPGLGTPMLFLGQVVLPADVAGNFLGGKVAYLFVTDGTDKSGEYVCGGEIGDGESAAVVQPGVPTAVKTTKRSAGPALYHFDQNGPLDRTGRLKRRLYPEYVVDLTPGTDPDHVPEAVLWGWDNDDPTKGGWPEAERNTYCKSIQGNKIGGTPAFMQGDEFPAGDDWFLLLQLEQLPDPCINLGDAGTGHFFMSRDGRRSEYLVQCA